MRFDGATTTSIRRWTSGNNTNGLEQIAQVQQTNKNRTNIRKNKAGSGTVGFNALPPYEHIALTA